MADNQIPAGWYPDPTGATSRIRYWNGSGWTEDYMDTAASPGQPYGQQPAYPGASVGGASGAWGAQGMPTGPGMPGMPGVPGMPGMAAEKDRKAFAVASLVLGILGLFACVLNWIDVPITILAIVFGILGLKSSKRSMAVVGLVLGAISFALAVAVFFLALNMIQNPTNWGLPADYWTSRF